MPDREGQPTSQSIEEYLEAIYKCQQWERPVRPGNLARKLLISPGAVSEMARKLAERGLIIITPQRRLHLTKKGEAQAFRIIRRHRLAECFLAGVLGLPWDMVHQEACKLEHAISGEVEERLEDFLQRPRRCPHGHPIPGRNGSIVKQALIPLAGLSPGAKAVITQVAEEDPEMLRYLASLGLFPEVEVEVTEVAPFGGPLTVRVGAAQYALGRELAQSLLVKGERA